MKTLDKLRHLQMAPIPKNTREEESWSCKSLSYLKRKRSYRSRRRRRPWRRRNLRSTQLRDGSQIRPSLRTLENRPFTLMERVMWDQQIIIKHFLHTISTEFPESKRLSTNKFTTQHWSPVSRKQTGFAYPSFQSKKKSFCQSKLRPGTQ